MNSVKNIKKNLMLSKPLLVSSIIIGEPYCGKLTFVKEIFPDAYYVDANDSVELNSALLSNDEIVIYNFEAINEIESLNFDNKRVIAIANRVIDTKKIEKKFAFIYHFPPLRERVDEVIDLVEKFKKEIRDDLMIDKEFKIELDSLDLSQNFKSLKISLYKEIIKKSLTFDDIKEILYELFLDKLDGKNCYKDYLHIYEKPLIKAGLKKYKSQLKLADILGLNRNTLRKKINEHNIN